MWTERFRIRPVSHCKEGCRGLPAVSNCRQAYRNEPRVS